MVLAMMICAVGLVTRLVGRDWPMGWPVAGGGCTRGDRDRAAGCARGIAGCAGRIGLARSWARRGRGVAACCGGPGCCAAS